MSELSPGARALIEAAKGADSPSSADKLRVQEGLYAKLGISAAAVASTGAATTGGAAGPSGLMNATSGAGVGSSGTGMAVATKIGLALVAVAGITVAGYYAVRSSDGGKNRQPTNPATAVVVSSNKQVVVDAEPKRQPVVVEPVQTTEEQTSKKPAAVTTDDVAPQPKPVVTKPKKRPVNRTKKHIQPKPQKPNTMNALRQEQRLMARAQNAARDGDATLALELLAQHAKKFPNGILVPERYGTRVLALCALGKKSSAKATASQFLRRWARHPMAGRVRRSCGN